jgi:hypothetical protein
MFHGWADGETRFRVEAMNGRSFAALAAAAKTDARIKPRVDQFVVGVPLSFFDLEKDPDERTNRVADPQYRARWTGWQSCSWPTWSGRATRSSTPCARHSRRCGERGGAGTQRVRT